MDNADSKPNMQDMQEGSYPEKGRRVLLTSLPRSSTGQKRIAGLQRRLRGRQVLGTFFLKPAEI
jgi:hypothetical protein